MANVNNIRNINTHFSQEVSDYLEAQGYRRMDGESGTITFQNGKKAMIVKNDNADFLVYQDGETDQRRPGYSRYMALTGIGDLDLFKWMLLLHVADIVSIKDLVRKVKKEAPEEIPGFLVTIYDHFKVTDDHNAVPVAY